MDKPISVAIAELERGIENVINEAHLHPKIVQIVLQNYLALARDTAQQFELRESLAWEESQKEGEE